jgi:cyclopropane fatty-acyl-phospholipid synthase-like methyltransferase
MKVTNRRIYEVRLASGKLYGQIGPRDIRRFEDTLKYISRDVESILDIGCSRGDWLHFVLTRRSFRRHLGIDVSHERVAEARDRFPDILFEEGYAETFQPEDRPFDLVTSLEVLEHIPDWESVFRSLFRLATRQVVVTVPHREKILQTPCIHCGKLTPLYGHLHTFTEESFPEIEGWRRRWTRLRDRDPRSSSLRKAYRVLRPRYPWLLVSYKKEG